MELPVIEFANLTEATDIVRAVHSEKVDVILKNSFNACEVFGFDLTMAQMREIESLAQKGAGNITLCFDAGDNPIYAMAAAEHHMKMVCFTGSDELREQIIPVFKEYKTKFMPQSKKRIDFWGKENIYNQCKQWLEHAA